MEGVRITQNNMGGSRGKQKTFYIVPEIEQKAKELCKREGLSFSLLIRIALEEYIERKG